MADEFVPVRLRAGEATGILALGSEISLENPDGTGTLPPTINSVERLKSFLNLLGFLNLEGTPSAWGNAGQIPQINATGDGLEWVDKPTGGSGPAPATEPEITAFTVSGWSQSLPDNTNVGRSRTISYTVARPNLVQGNMALRVNGSVVATNIDPNATSATFNFPSNTLRTGQSATAILSGLSTNGVAFNRSTTARVPDPFYAGSATASSITGISGFASQAYATTQRITIPAWNGNRYLYFAQLASRADIESVFVDGFDQISAFTKQSNITVAGATYEVWRTTRTQIGSFYPTGYTARITR